VEAQRLVLCSTRGVAQRVEFHLEPVAGGFCVKSQRRVDGCIPRPGDCMLTPLSLESALKWANARAAKLMRSTAAFRPAKTVEDRIEELFFG